MLLPFQTVRNNNKYTSVFSAAILSCRACLVVIIFAGHLADANSDISICHKLWSVLGKDLAAWRERCIDGVEQSQCCKAEKEYFEERRLAHRKMCFYEGK